MINRNFKSSDDFFLREFFAAEELFHQRVVGFRYDFGKIIIDFLRLRSQLLGHFAFGKVPVLIKHTGFHCDAVHNSD